MPLATGRAKLGAAEAREGTDAGWAACRPKAAPPASAITPTFQTQDDRLLSFQETCSRLITAHPAKEVHPRSLPQPRFTLVTRGLHPVHSVVSIRCQRGRDHDGVPATRHP